MYKFIKVLKILVKITPETIPGILFEERFVRFVADFFCRTANGFKGLPFWEYFWKCLPFFGSLRLPRLLKTRFLQESKTPSNFLDILQRFPPDFLWWLCPNFIRNFGISYNVFFFRFYFSENSFGFLTRFLTILSQNHLRFFKAFF